MTVEVIALTGADLQAVLADLARLRIEVFREWPYLYDGSYDYEQSYLAEFASAAGSVIVAARDGERIVGAATATPMGGHAAAFARPFVERGMDIGRIFYFGESVLLPAYRGRGIGHTFFDRREGHARGWGRTHGSDPATDPFTHAIFCAVVRPESHPLKPAGYRPLDAFWRKRGYVPVPDLVGTFAWKDIGDATETAKPMQYWMKAL